MWIGDGRRSRVVFLYVPFLLSCTASLAVDCSSPRVARRRMGLSVLVDLPTHGFKRSLPLVVASV